MTFEFKNAEKSCGAKGYEDILKHTQYKICDIRAVFLEGNVPYICKGS